MAAKTLIEPRLSAVEAAVAELQRKVDLREPPPNWLEQVIGTFKDEPAFDEVVALGRIAREASRPPGEDGS